MILVIDMNWKKDSLAYPEFVAPIVRAAEALETCVVKHFTEVEASDLGKYRRIILSGTALKDHATLAQPEKFKWLTTLETPVLGICAGMQTIGVTFGLRLRRCLRIGMTQVTTLKENPLFSSQFRAYSLHNFSVESSQEFDSLAESANCLQAMKHKEKPVYGVLFHPEVRNPEILERFIRVKQL
ncbi:MAG: hypothetical protein ACE14S_10245 [Candidatus Bathyarchaeia archaeon]